MECVGEETAAWTETAAGSELLLCGRQLAVISGTRGDGDWIGRPTAAAFQGGGAVMHAENPRAEQAATTVVVVVALASRVCQRDALPWGFPTLSLFPFPRSRSFLVPSQADEREE